MVVNNDILKLWFSKFNLNEDFFDNYEASSKSVLQNLTDLINNLRRIFLSQERIVIVSDFDADGIMSGVIAYSGLSELGFNVNLYESNPRNGYGFHVCDVDNIVQKYPDVKIVLTADVGISANEAIDYAKSLGVETWVTDHHLSFEGCNATIAVNPNQLGESYDQPNICGAFVIYKVLEAYAFAYADLDKQLYIYCLRLFAGIATIADVMTLTGENRQLARDAIFLLCSLYNGEFPGYFSGQSAFSGVVAILKYLRDMNKINRVEDINEELLGFYFIPLINSIKRMGGDIRAAYDIFFRGEVAPDDGVANNLRVNNALSYITELSDKRRELTTAWFDFILANQDAVKCNVVITTAPQGLLGLLAAKMTNLSGAPTLVLRYDAVTDSYRGSGRSPSWFHFPNEVKNAGLKLTAAGHAGAFGVNCPSTKALNEYYEFYERVIQARSVSLDDYVSPEIIINDDVIGLKADFSLDVALIRDFLEEYEEFRPWGVGFTPPRFRLFLNAGFKAKTFGSNFQHAKFVADGGLEVLLFNNSRVFEGICDKNGYVDGVICVCGHFALNFFNGAETLSFFAESITKIERSALYGGIEKAKSA